MASKALRPEDECNSHHRRDLIQFPRIVFIAGNFKTNTSKMTEASCASIFELT